MQLLRKNSPGGKTLGLTTPTCQTSLLTTTTSLRAYSTSRALTYRQVFVHVEREVIPHAAIRGRRRRPLQSRRDARHSHEVGDTQSRY